MNSDELAFLDASGTMLGCNLFAYCENNPVNYSDPWGHWIQYAIGAVLGGILNVIFYTIDCAIEKVGVTMGKILLNFLNGAVNGVIAATGAKVIWQIVAGVSNGIVALFIGATEPTMDGLITAVICGVLSGVLAGTMPKSATKHINYLMQKFGKKVGQAVFKTSFGKTLLKSFRYVFKNSKKLIWKFIKDYCIPNFYIGIAPRIKSLLDV